MVRIQITGADVSEMLERFSENGLVLFEIRHIDFLCAEFTTTYFGYKHLKYIIKNRNCKIQVLKIGGPESIFLHLRNRYIFLTVLGIILFLSLWLPSRILFISVEGNDSVPTVRILQQAEECGIYFGAKRSVVRSEIVKNNLLENMPELRWAGINTQGCIATISVREESAQETIENDVKFSSIIAARDGVVLSITTTSGYPACSVGQAVTEGQTLVSGSQCDGILYKTVRSKAEVFAQTNRNLSVVTPVLYVKKGEQALQQTKYSLIVGKNRINLSKGSGISYTGCDKMYQEYHLTLPGGFVLPVSLVVETVTQYDSSFASVSDLDAQTLLADYADGYLPEQMVSGKIITRNTAYSNQEDVALLEADYICIEMIARERAEELDFYYGKDR